MPSVKQIIDLANTSHNRAYQILTFPTHERYETQLAKTGHDFYSFHLPDLKKWNREQIAPPTNYHILPESQLCEFIPYDFILVQSKFWQFQVAQQINQMLRLPIICLEHTLPTPQTISPNNLAQMRNMVGNFNVFISKFSQKEWGINYNTKIIHHGIDTQTFRPFDFPEGAASPYVLTVANDFVKRDYCLNYKGWERVTKDLPVKLVGDTPGLSKSAGSTEELVVEYNKCAVYFNSSTLSPIPTSLLEAMSCGCAVVSTATCMIPEIIENGVNGFISNDESELRSMIEVLMSDPEKRREMGDKARETIQTKFSEQSFIQEWNKVFNMAYEAKNR